MPNLATDRKSTTQSPQNNRQKFQAGLSAWLSHTIVKAPERAPGLFIFMTYLYVESRFERTQQEHFPDDRL